MEKGSADKHILLFTTQPEWRAWLEKHHTQLDGVWLQMYKKASGKQSINYDQALDEALCYGWIDGLVNKYDDASYIQKFTPRRAKSMWSKRNREHIARLTQAGKMTASGLTEVARAKADGRWEAAYDAPSTMVIPEDFLTELAKVPQAEAFFKTLNKTNTYAIIWRLQTAKKPETRERRMKVILDMLAKGEKFH
jgi:uncharacterized protein YdeI (YjbR/CyaY-like superfamily)